MSAPETNGSRCNPTQASSKTQVPSYWYGLMSMIEFIFGLQKLENSGRPTL